MIIEFKGREGISAKVIADSISSGGIRMTTLELEAPRFILAEENTHRMLSKNTASSRAIPVMSMIDYLLNHTAMPVYFGRNQSGMVAGDSLDDYEIELTKKIWNEARDNAIAAAKRLHEIGNHKQVVNRVIEPYTMSKTVMSGTEWVNLLWLRHHPDAQPEFQELAKCIHGVLNQSVPIKLRHNEWHLPYVTCKYEGGIQTYWSGEIQIDLETAQKISASCCAQVSYRKNNETIEQAEKVFGMLNLDQDEVPKHASPVEHQATPMESFMYTPFPHTWEKGVTHMDREMHFWSGNLRGWIQYRKLIPNEARW